MWFGNESTASAYVRRRPAHALQAGPVFAKRCGADIKPRRIAACYRCELAAQDAAEHERAAAAHQFGETRRQRLEWACKDVREQNVDAACQGRAIELHREARGDAVSFGVLPRGD